MNTEARAAARGRARLNRSSGESSVASSSGRKYLWQKNRPRVQDDVSIDELEDVNENLRLQVSKLQRTLKDYIDGRKRNVSFSDSDRGSSRTSSAKNSSRRRENETMNTSKVSTISITEIEKFEQLRDMYLDLEREYNNSQRQNSSLKSENKTLKERVSFLAEEKGVLLKQNEDLVQVNETLQGTVKALQVQLEVMNVSHKGTSQNTTTASVDKEETKQHRWRTLSGPKEGVSAASRYEKASNVAPLSPDHSSSSEDSQDDDFVDEKGDSRDLAAEDLKRQFNNAKAQAMRLSEKGVFGISNSSFGSSKSDLRSRSVDSIQRDLRPQGEDEKVESESLGDGIFAKVVSDVPEQPYHHSLSRSTSSIIERKRSDILNPARAVLERAAKMRHSAPKPHSSVDPDLNRSSVGFHDGTKHTDGNSVLVPRASYEGKLREWLLGNRFDPRGSNNRSRKGRNGGRLSVSFSDDEGNMSDGSVGSVDRGVLKYLKRLENEAAEASSREELLSRSVDDIVTLKRQFAKGNGILSVSQRSPHETGTKEKTISIKAGRPVFQAKDNFSAPEKGEPSVLAKNNTYCSKDSSALKWELENRILSVKQDRNPGGGYNINSVQIFPSDNQEPVNPTPSPISGKNTRSKPFASRVSVNVMRPLAQRPVLLR